MFLGRKRVPLSAQLYKALCSVYGIGRTRALMLSSKLGCVRKTKLGFIKSRKRKIISRYIDAHYSTENLLRRKVRIILRNHLIHGSYKGIRFRQGFPVNGQRTRSNAQTSRKRLLLKELKINIK